MRRWDPDAGKKVVLLHGDEAEEMLFRLQVLEDVLRHGDDDLGHLLASCADTSVGFDPEGAQGVLRAWADMLAEDSRRLKERLQPPPVE